MLAVALLASAAAGAFTQSGLTLDAVGSGVPMGHEWITRIGVFEVIGGDPLQPQLNDPNDPRKHWTRGLAKNPNLTPAAKAYVEKLRTSPVKGDDTRYRATYRFILSAIIGERWVDIGGFNVASSDIFAKYNCWDGGAQEPADLQQDHSMRRYDDSGGAGGVAAASRAQTRFIAHFMAAVNAPEQDVMVWDGGGYAARVQVNSNYFLLGRAAHLFQDAFSSEHVVRTSVPDNFERVRQVKSYLCALGAEQHTHSQKEILDYTSGDVIWNVGTRLDVGWTGYKASHMKTVALVATEANRDLWAAFLRVMALPQLERSKAAAIEAQTLVDNWLAFDANEVTHWYDADANRIENYVLASGQTGKGMTQSDCMKNVVGVPSGSQQERVAQLEQEQLACVFNLQSTPGYADLNDPFLHMPFNWEWKSATTWQTPPPGWTLPVLSPNAGKQVSIRTALAQNAPLIAMGALESGTLIKVGNASPLAFTMVAGTDERYYFRTRDDASLMLSYETIGGRAQLYEAWTDVARNAAAFRVTQAQTCASAGWALENVSLKAYLWVDNPSTWVFISGRGNPVNANAQWFIDGMPALKPSPPGAAGCPAAGR